MTIQAVVVRPQVDPPPRSQSGITDWWKFKDLDSISEEDKLPSPYQVVPRGDIMNMWLCTCESQWIIIHGSKDISYLGNRTSSKFQKQP